jgi:hypothetical protein
MSDVVNTAADTFSGGQSHCGGVAVAPCGEPAAGTPEGSPREPQACLSLPAPRTHHRPVGGRHPHHRCPRPRATVDQLGCGCTDRGVSGLARHGERGQKKGLEVLDGDHLRVLDTTLGPNSGVVQGLPRALLVQLRRLAAGPQAALRWGLTARPSAAGHPGRQAQPTVAKREAPERVFRGGQGFPVGLELGPAPALDFQGVAQRLGVGPQGLLLGELRTLTQPRDATSCLRELLGQAVQRRAVSAPLLVDRLVPQEPATVPVSQQCAARLCAGAQAVGVTHRLEHMYYQIPSRRIVLGWTRPERPTASCTAAPTTSCGAAVHDARSSKEPSTNVLNRSSGRSAPRRTRPSSSSTRCQSAYTRSWSVIRSTPIHSPGQNHQRQVLTPAPSGVSHPRDPGSRSYGPTRTSSPLSAAQPWRSSNAMSRTNPTQKLHPYAPKAEAMGFSGAFR